MQFLTGRSLGTRILRFDLETKLTKTLQNYPKIRGQTKGGRSHNRPPPEYATGIACTCSIRTPHDVDYVVSGLIDDRLYADRLAVRANIFIAV